MKTMKIAIDPYRLTNAFSGNEILLDPDEAVLLVQLIYKAESWRQEYTQGSDVAHYVVKPNFNRSVEMKAISEELYRIAKLAGEGMGED